jgi:hypothetical protein
LKRLAIVEKLLDRDAKKEVSSKQGNLNFAGNNFVFEFFAFIRIFVTLVLRCKSIAVSIQMGTSTGNNEVSFLKLWKLINLTKFQGSVSSESSDKTVTLRLKQYVVSHRGVSFR